MLVDINLTTLNKIEDIKESIEDIKTTSNYNNILITRPNRRNVLVIFFDQYNAWSNLPVNFNKLTLTFQTPILWHKT